MLLNSSSANDSSLYGLRVKDLIRLIQEHYPAVKKGTVVLFGALENERYRFRQESSFYYLTGIQEPAAVALFNFDGTSTLYVPEHEADRARWVHSPLPLVQSNAKKLGFSYIKPLGEMVPGYQFHPFSDKKHYSNLSADLAEFIQSGGKIFTLNPSDSYQYVAQRWLLARFATFVPGFLPACSDISPLVAILRRKKDMHEIEQLYKAVEVTILAQGAAAQAISDGITEAEVQASLEYMFTGSGATPAFASIVAGGKNATILHYTTNNAPLKHGQLALVDIGAELNYYCADLTRTYPVSGSFTKRQKELYNLVLETQEYIAQRARPGMWLSNSKHPDTSLNHLAKKFLEERGYGKYFIHSIGHFLGMDVHDVGDTKEPLQEGDVFTIEPGIYIPEEQIGIRIEDNYWMVKDGPVCLSEALPKKADEVERLMQETLESEPEEEYQEFDETDEEGDEDQLFAKG